MNYLKFMFVLIGGITSMSIGGFAFIIVNAQFHPHVLLDWRDILLFLFLLFPQAYATSLALTYLSEQNRRKWFDKNTHRQHTAK